MPEYRVNDSAVRQARQLIDDGRFDDRTEWSDAAPDAAAANDVIEQEGFDAFAAWHLAEDPDASEGTKGRYAFPYGERPTAGSPASLRVVGGSGSFRTTRPRGWPTSCCNGWTRTGRADDAHPPRRGRRERGQGAFVGSGA
jgi:hypothetical protein